MSWSGPDPGLRGSLTPEELWTTVYPAALLTGEPSRLDEVTAFLHRRLTESMGFQPADAVGATPQTLLYQRGGKRRRALAILADAMTTGGGGRFNITYYILLERTAPTDLLFSVHGIDATLRARFSPHQTFGDLFAEGGALFPDVASTSWFDSRTLPTAFASSPDGIARLLGATRAFWST